jgi:hypothetical protein
MPVEILVRELPPAGSVWVVDCPDDLEAREVEVKVPDGTTKRYLVDHAERLDGQPYSSSGGASAPIPLAGRGSGCSGSLPSPAWSACTRSYGMETAAKA